MNENDNTTINPRPVKDLKLIPAVLAVLLLMFLTSMLFYKITDLETKTLAIGSRLKSCRADLANAVAQKKDTNLDYATYDTPMYPGYTLNWKLFISKINNFLFLYPENFNTTNSSENLYDAIEFTNESGGIIYAQRLKKWEITDNSKSQTFEKFLQDLAVNNELKSEEGYQITKNEELTSTSGYVFIKEFDSTTNVTYLSVLIRHAGGSETTLIRTLNVSNEDLRALTESFKYLREQ